MLPYHNIKKGFYLKRLNIMFKMKYIFIIRVIKVIHNIII